MAESGGDSTQTALKATPAQKARKALELIYDHKCEQLGCNPTLETFYPVDPSELLALLGSTLVIQFNDRRLALARVGV